MRTEKQIDEELVSIDSLRNFINHHTDSTACLPIRENNDPPDFWITIDGEKFAAEVTSITGNKEYFKRFEYFKNIVIKLANEYDLMKGKYVLGLSRYPEIPKRNTAEWQTLVNTTVDLIISSKSVPLQSRIQILKDTKGELCISKISDSGANLGHLFIPDMKWPSNTLSELSQKIQVRLNKKRKKLEKKEIRDKVIICLYDEYLYGDIETVLDSFKHVSGDEWYHSVYWCASFSNRDNDLTSKIHGRGGMFLYSKNINWLRKS
ncbi:hypothetical protein ACFL67_00640 [candidate division KSB1 bacterium]